MFTEDITAIVLDTGSLQFKSGYSGEDTPRVVMNSYYGQQDKAEEKNGDAMEQEEVKNQYYLDDQEVKYTRNNVKVQSTYSRGKIIDKDAFAEKIKTIYKQLGVGFNDYSLLVSEPSIHNQKEREILSEVVFENLQVPNFFVCKAGVLSSFSSNFLQLYVQGGRSTAFIIDSGAYQTYAVPIFDGYCLQKSIIKFDIGGEFLTDMMMDHIENKLKKEVRPRFELDPSKNVSGVSKSYREMMRYEVVRDIKENVCRVDDKGMSIGEIQADKSECELPDGTNLQFDTARSEFCDYFFSRTNKQEYTPDFFNNPDLINFKGIQHMAIDSINQCDIDIKRELFSNIILTGGNSLLNGFSSKLSQKLNDVAPPNSRLKMIAYPSTVERKYSSWIGGSILASLGSFQSLWISKAEYEENGSIILEKKCA